MERIVRTLLSHPSTLTAVALEKRSAGPTHRRDRKYNEVKLQTKFKQGNKIYKVNKKTTQT